MDIRGAVAAGALVAITGVIGSATVGHSRSGPGKVSGLEVPTIAAMATSGGIIGGMSLYALASRIKLPVIPLALGGAGLLGGALGQAALNDARRD